MAHAHHHHAAPSVTEGRTGFRRGAAFIIGGLSSGHGVFHSIAQSFIVVLPEVRDLLLGGSVIAATSIQTTREIASGVVALPGGVLTDALRRYWGWVMAVCMAMFGVGWLLMSAAGWQVPGATWVASGPSAAATTSLNPAGYALLIIGMAVVAIAASVWHLPAMAALSSHFTHRRGSVLSFHGVGGNIGDVIGPVLTGALLASLAWQAIITIYAAVPLFLAFLVFWAFRDIGQRAQAAVEERATNTMRTQIAETKLLVRNPRVWGITVVAGLRGMAYIGFITVLPLYLVDELNLGSTLTEHRSFENLFIRGSLVGLLVLVGIFASPVMGYLSDRLNRKIVLIPGMLFLAVVTLLMAPFGSNLAVMTILLAALGLFLYSDQPILTAAAMDIVREGTAATTLGLLSTSRFILSAASPIIAGWLYVINYDYLFYYTAALYLVAALLLAVIRLPQLAVEADHHDDHGHGHGGHGHDDHGDGHDGHGHGHHDDHGHGHDHGDHGHGEHGHRPH